MAASQNEEEDGASRPGRESRARGMRPNSMISRPQDGRAAPEAVPGGGQGSLLRCPLGERPGEPVHPPARLALCGGPHQPGLARHRAEVHAGDRLPAHGGCRAPGGVAWRGVAG